MEEKQMEDFVFRRAYFAILLVGCIGSRILKGYFWCILELGHGSRG